MNNQITVYLDDILKKIKEVGNCKKSDNDDFNSKIINALRVYYLGISSVFIVNKLLKKADFSSIKLEEEEKKHVENFGWLLDEKYVNNVYFQTLKTDLLINSWIVFKSYIVDSKEENLDFMNFYKNLIRSLENNSKGLESTSYELNSKSLSIEKNKDIDFITMDIALELIIKLVKTYNNLEIKQKKPVGFA